MAWRICGGYMFRPVTPKKSSSLHANQAYRRFYSAYFITRVRFFIYECSDDGSNSTVHVATSRFLNKKRYQTDFDKSKYYLKIIVWLVLNFDNANLISCKEKYYWVMIVIVVSDGLLIRVYGAVQSSYVRKGNTINQQTEDTFGVCWIRYSSNIF